VDIGAELRTARERAGVSLEDLAARTRIPLKSLRAIERNDFSSVPPGLFARAFIRSFARELGMDPTAAVAEYRAMTEPVAEAGHESKNGGAANDVQPTSFDPEVLTSRPGWGYVLIAGALLIGVISMNRYVASDRTEVSAADTTVSQAASPDAARTVGTAGSAVQIDVHAEGLCWVRAVADGQIVIARVLQPGEMQSISAQRDIVIRVGDPAAISYSINGQQGEPLGPARVPVTVRIGADGRISAKS
jgi:cytoskeleton protein RodZ